MNTNVIDLNDEKIVNAYNDIPDYAKENEGNMLKHLKIVKKTGQILNYNPNKIIEAANKSAARARENGKLTEKEETALIFLIENELKSLDTNMIETKTIHTLVEKTLKAVAPDVAIVYEKYHSFRMSQAKSWEKIMDKCTTLLSDSTSISALTIKAQNANADSTLSSTLKCFFADYTSEGYFEEFFLTQEELQLSEDGYIYIHDKNGRNIYTLNCCLFDMAYVLENGAFINGIPYFKPKSLDSAFDVIGDLILIAASQQYGGFTVPRIDSILVPYAEMSYNRYLDKYIKLGVSEEKAKEQANLDVQKEFDAGFQGLEYKLNTVGSSRGDYPFVTFTLGLDTTKFGKMAAISCLNTRKNGQGEEGKKVPVLFPKLVFLYDKNLHEKDKENHDIFEAGLECSSKTMYPDWLSLTGEGYVASMYKKYGIDGVISPMGCRAFLSPYFENGGFEPADENDKPVFEGRFNLGVVSLNLPMILAKSREEKIDFYEVLDHILEVVRNFHKRIREYIGRMKASRNPLGFQYGGFYGGHLNPDDEIKPVLKSATMSFGITALNELQQLYNGKSLVEDGQFALECMEHINEKITEFKKEDHILYAIYGTPAENLCGKQVKQFRAKYGIIKNVSDRDYVSNSFHCHVTEDISPIQKQDLEYRFWELFNGGKIQYCKYPLGYNIMAMESLILRAMEMGFYEGVNISMCFCTDCGYQQPEMGSYCPVCNSPRITQIDRMNGYLSYTRVGSESKEVIDENGNKTIQIRSRFSPHKFKEIQERVSM